MKKTILLSAVFLVPLCLMRGQEEIRLLVRGDDMGSSHAANLACMDAYRNGIMRSVELMVPCPWFEEACRLLNENPGLDVGIHLVLTSEWDEYKWRPLTHCPSITDEDGYFYPMIWPGEDYPESRTLLHSDWDMAEVEAELRAQIELALKKVPRISHLSGHMGCMGFAPELSELYDRLKDEYHLRSKIAAEGYGHPAGRMKHMNGWDRAASPEKQVAQFVGNLERLTPGTWLFVEHPAYDTPEMEGVFHKGYEDVGRERERVTKIFTHPDVMDAIERLHIRLISYRDL